MPRLADPGAGSPAPMLAVLWRVLVPEAERRALVDGTVKRLVVVPDGPLAFLPFEALVVEGRKDPKYLLDVGPPIAYAQSATVLINLADRHGSAGPGDREPVLALGDPAYPGAEPAPGADLAAGAMTARSRFSLAGGKLPRLPYSGLEVAVGGQGVPRRRRQGGRLHRAHGHRSGRALLGARPAASSTWPATG